MVLFYINTAREDPGDFGECKERELPDLGMGR